jgi:hypothetical protein
MDRRFFRLSALPTTNPEYPNLLTLIFTNVEPVFTLGKLILTKSSPSLLMINGSLPYAVLASLYVRFARQLSEHSGRRCTPCGLRKEASGAMRNLL